MRTNHLILLLFAPGVGASVVTYEQLFGGPGTSAQTDALFVSAGNTDYESFGFESSFNTTMDARINALVGPGDFQFNQARVDIPSTWVSGRTYRFTQTYSGDATRQISISVLDTVTNTPYSFSYTAAYGNIAGLVVRMVAPDPDMGTNRPSAGSLTFSNWTLNGATPEGMPGTLALSTSDTPGVDDPRLINYFQISGIDFAQAWTLEGNFVMAWSGGVNNPLPSANHLAFQVKAYQRDLTPVPEPATLALCGGVLLLIGLYGPARKRHMP